MAIKAAIEATAAALYEAKHEERNWEDAKSPDVWREYARVALAAGLPLVMQEISQDFMHVMTRERLGPWLKDRLSDLL